MIDEIQKQKLLGIIEKLPDELIPEVQRYLEIKQKINEEFSLKKNLDRVIKEDHEVLKKLAL